MYEDVRQSKNPKQALIDFLNSTYDEAAGLAKWNDQELERK